MRWNVAQCIFFCGLMWLNMGVWYNDCLNGVPMVIVFLLCGSMKQFQSGDYVISCGLTLLILV